MITPTVGRIVWYYGAGRDVPWAAIVTGIPWPNRINVTLFPPDGEPPEQRVGVQLVQGDEEHERAYCTWMPYQKGQAAKTEALEKRIATSEAQVSQP